MANHEEGKEGPTNEANAHHLWPLHHLLPLLSFLSLPPLLSLLPSIYTHRTEGGEGDLEEGKGAVTAESQCKRHTDSEGGEVDHPLSNCGTDRH